MFNGTAWERLPHLPAPCWACADWNRETREREEPKGFRYHYWSPEEAAVLEAEGYKRLDESNGRIQMDKKMPCTYCKGTLIIYPQIYQDRNYHVFSLLADVRNGGGIQPIDEPRGLPDDMSAELVDRLRQWGQDAKGQYLARDPNEDEEEREDLYEKLEAEKEGAWDLGEHSHSWLTLAEVLEFPYEEASVRMSGFVDPWNFELFRRNGKPQQWTGGVSGTSIEHVTAMEMARNIDTGDIIFEGDDADWMEPDFFQERPYSTGLSRAMSGWSLPEGTIGQQIRDNTRHFCAVEWEQPYLDTLGGFRKRMQDLVEHAPDGDLAKIRLVFGFDS